MIAAMGVLKVRIPDIVSNEILQSTSAFKAAFSYLQTPIQFSGTPTLSVNGTIIDAFPTREVIDHLIQSAQGISK